VPPTVHFFPYFLHLCTLTMRICRRTRLGRLPHWSREVAQFTYLDAPHELPKKEGNEVAGRYWFGRTPTGEWDQVTLDASLALLQETWVAQGPFSGILAFSQGGTFATLAASLASSSCRLPQLKFVVCFGAPELAKWPTSRQIPADIRSLHFGGKTDAIVPIASSRALANRYAHSEFHEHEQGHCIPMKRPAMDIVIRFMTEMKIIIESSCDATALDHGSLDDGEVTVDGTTPDLIIFPDEAGTPELSFAPNVTNTKTPENGSAGPVCVPLCSSESCAEQQMAELEALQAIFGPPEISVIRPAPAASGQPTGCVVVTLLPPTGANEWFCGDQLQLRFEMTENYPEKSPLNIQLQTGTLSLLQLTIAMRKSLISRLVRYIYQWYRHHLFIAGC
jgi:predicted esterase